MKRPNGLKTIILVLAEKEKINKSIIYTFRSTQTPDATPAPQVTVVKSPAPTPDQPLIGTLQACFLVMSVKLQSILQKNTNKSS